MDGWFRWKFLLGRFRPILRCELAVSFRGPCRAYKFLPPVIIIIPKKTGWNNPKKCPHKILGRISSPTYTRGPGGHWGTSQRFIVLGTRGGADRSSSPGGPLIKWPASALGPTLNGWGKVSNSGWVALVKVVWEMLEVAGLMLVNFKVFFFGDGGKIEMFVWDFTCKIQDVVLKTCLCEIKVIRNCWCDWIRLNSLILPKQNLMLHCLNWPSR